MSNDTKQLTPLAAHIEYLDAEIILADKANNIGARTALKLAKINALQGLPDERAAMEKMFIDGCYRSGVNNPTSLAREVFNEYFTQTPHQ